MNAALIRFFIFVGSIIFLGIFTMLMFLRIIVLEELNAYTNMIIWGFFTFLLLLFIDACKNIAVAMQQINTNTTITNNNQNMSNEARQLVEYYEKLKSK